MPPGKTGGFVLVGDIRKQSLSAFADTEGTDGGTGLAKPS